MKYWDAKRYQPSQQSNTVPSDEEIEQYATYEDSTGKRHVDWDEVAAAKWIRSRMLSIAKEREILFGKFVRENAGLFGKNSDKNIEQLHDLYLSTKTPTNKS